MPHAIGMDVGGSKLGLAIVRKDGAILSEDQAPTQAAKPFADRFPEILAALELLLKRANLTLESCLGVGIGCPGPLDLENGTVLNPYTLPGWDKVNIVKVFSEEIGLPIFLENDADAALVGEWYAGAGQGCKDLVMLTIGTGIGGAALAGGELYRGKQGEHPEIGYIPVDRAGPSCYCGIKGCLESLASGEGIGEQGAEMGFSGAQEVFDQAKAGNSRAEAIVERAIAALESAVWTIMHTFLPEKLILGGGVLERHPDLYLDALQELSRKGTLISA